MPFTAKNSHSGTSTRLKVLITALTNNASFKFSKLKYSGVSQSGKKYFISTLLANYYFEEALTWHVLHDTGFADIWFCILSKNSFHNV